MGSIAGAGGSLFLRKSLVAAQVALSFLLLFGAGLFVRSLQNLKGDRHRRRAGQPRDVPAFAGLQRLQRRTRGDLQPAARRSPARVGRRQVGRLFRCVHSQWRRVGQLDVGRRAQGRRRRRHAGVHERRVAGLLRGHEDSAPRRTRLHAHGRDAAGRRPSVARVHREQEVRRPLLPGQERRRTPRGTGRRVRTRSSPSRSSASSPTRSTKDRAKACTGRCSCRTTATRASPTTCAARWRRRRSTR